MADYRIESRDGPPGTPFGLWANVPGDFRYATAETGVLRGRKAIWAAARALLAEVREGHPRGLVRVVDPRGREHRVNGEKKDARIP